jgi:hypothetical protein
VGYGVIVGLNYLHNYLEEVGKKVPDNKGRNIVKGLDPGAGKRLRPKGGAPNAPPPPEETRTAAGDDQTIGFTKVRVVRATRPGPVALDPTRGLTITLRITNLGLAPVTYYRKSLTLRDRTKPPKPYPLLNPKENPIVPGGKSIDDVLEFGTTNRSSILDLDLPASASDQKFEFYIPTRFIETTQ